MKHDSKKQHWLVVNKSYWFQDIIIKANSILYWLTSMLKTGYSVHRHTADLMFEKRGSHEL